MGSDPGKLAEYRELLRVRRASRDRYDDPAFKKFTRLLLKVGGVQGGKGEGLQVEGQVEGLSWWHLRWLEQQSGRAARRHPLLWLL